MQSRTKWSSWEYLSLELVVRLLATTEIIIYTNKVKRNNAAPEASNPTYRNYLPGGLTVQWQQEPPGELIFLKFNTFHKNTD